MYPNPALAAWEMAVMAVIPVMALAVWLTAIFLAARQPRRDQAAAAPTQTELTTAGRITRAGADELGPARQQPAADTKAA